MGSAQPPVAVHSAVADASTSQPHYIFGSHFRQVRSTAALRWEWRPGSNIYAIWSHGQTSSDLARFDLGHDLEQFQRAPFGRHRDGQAELLDRSVALHADVFGDLRYLGEVPLDHLARLARDR
jgi:hypothetical protein